MARIRTVKPEFWLDEEMAELEPHTRLLAIGILNMADDEGYFKAHAALIRAAVFPFEDSLNIHGMLSELSKHGYLTICVGTDNKDYGLVNNFTKHQKVNRPNASKIKGLFVLTDNSLITHGQLTGGKEQGTGNREQGKEQGEEKETPQKRKRFVPPTLQECIDYSNNPKESSKFMHYYESNGWKVGKNKMVLWKSALKGWIERNENKFNNNQQKDRNGFMQTNHQEQSLRLGLDDEIPDYQGEQDE